MESKEPVGLMTIYVDDVLLMASWIRPTIFGALPEPQPVKQNILAIFDSVDGWNPAPADIVNIQSFTGVHYMLGCAGFLSTVAHQNP